MLHFAQVEDGRVVQVMAFPDTCLTNEDQPREETVQVHATDPETGEPLFENSFEDELDAEGNPVVLSTTVHATDPETGEHLYEVTRVPVVDGFGGPVLGGDGQPLMRDDREPVMITVVEPRQRLVRTPVVDNRTATVTETVAIEVPTRLELVLHPDMVPLFQPCPAEVAIGWTLDGEDWSPPVRSAGEIANMRLGGLGKAAMRAEELAAPLVAKYPATERETWRLQEGEARAVAAGTLAPGDASFLLALAGGNLNQVEPLAETIIVKADHFAAVSAGLIRARKAAEAAIADADTPDEIDAAIASAFAPVATLLAG